MRIVGIAYCCFGSLIYFRLIYIIDDIMHLSLSISLFSLLSLPFLLSYMRTTVNGSIITSSSYSKENNLSYDGGNNDTTVNREGKAYRNPSHHRNQHHDDQATTDSSDFTNDLKHLYRIYEECNAKELSSCLKLKLITAIDRLARKTELPIVDGIVLVKDGTQNENDDNHQQDDNNNVNSLPRSSEEKTEKLDAVVTDKILNFLCGRSIQFKLSGIADMRRSLQQPDDAVAIEDGRGKKNKMGSLMMIPLMMAGSMIPLALGTLALLAGKALIIAKLALTLSLIIGLKKLLSHDDSHGSSYQVVHGGGSGAGHYRRSIQAGDAAAAQSMAYRSYIPLIPDSSTNMYAVSR